MKKLSFLIVCLFSITSLFAQPPAGKANIGDSYGAKITADKAVSVNELPKALEASENVNTKIIGKVTEVCPKKGCWITLETADKTKVMVKMKDYGFFVPVDMIGKTIVLEGEAKIKTTSVEELQHYAEDAKKTKAEIAAITKPEKEIRFTANGILVVE